MNSRNKSFVVNSIVLGQYQIIFIWHIAT